MSCKVFDLAAFGDWRSVAAPYHGDNETVQGWRKMLRGSVFLDASSMNQAWTDWLNRKGIYSDELVKCAPPFDDCFVYGGFEISDMTGEPFEFGLQIHKVKPEELSSVIKSMKNPNGLYESAAFVLASRLWMRTKSRMLAVMGFQEMICLNSDGRFLGTVAYQISKEMAKHSCQWTLPLFAFQLMHCRNIVTEASTYRPNVPKGKRRKIPAIQYRTLKISDSLTKSTASNASDSSGETAKHVCRGNFAHYTEENKLFGKYVGMFWRPMHIRGNAKHGIVGKEYKL